MTDEVKRQAQHLSDTKGYRVLIPDLYKGKIGVDAEEAHHVCLYAALDAHHTFETFAQQLLSTSISNSRNLC